MPLSVTELQQLADQIRQWAQDLGFQDVGITDAVINPQEVDRLQEWLDKGYHGEMAYMEQNIDLRADPKKLHKGTLRVISVRMDYLPPDTETITLLNSSEKAYISRYALGRDYHKLIRKRLSQLGQKIEAELSSYDQSHHYRAFVDSAPVMERPLAQQAGLGWVGKNSLMMHRKAGSLFFLGELFTNLPLPIDEPYEQSHCGRCQSCMDKCPTQAIVAPYQIDARRCISYLTIENRGSIPEEFRKAMGNRIYGCDDCQLVCPWNRFAKPTQEAGFHPRHQLDQVDLLTLFEWTEAEFLDRTAGSPIRRIGYESWQRNISVALGNAATSKKLIAALTAKLKSATPMVQEHIMWALKQHQSEAQQKE